MSEKITFFWFRRDLRLEDNAGLYHALRSQHKVQCVFIFDKDILDKLQDRSDKRVSFIYDQLKVLAAALKNYKSSLITLYDTPSSAWKQLTSEYDIDAVYTNHDYEPYGIDRDDKIKKILEDKNIAFRSFKDIVIFEKNEIVRDNGAPYTIFTPYKNKFLSVLDIKHLESHSSEKYLSQLYPGKFREVMDLNKTGFEYVPHHVSPPAVEIKMLDEYEASRDFPALNGTSRLGVHLRFGTISIRTLARMAMKRKSMIFFSELIWREFYQAILWHFPYVVDGAFKKEYNHIRWRNNENEFKLWCEGKTGYPMVDAGMRELNATGFMHNRVRMITAGFLTKHLLIDWRWGEAYFASKLLDFELASNNGGWQWAAGSGTDAAPYFRIFNPSEQLRKFDNALAYVKKWIPEFDTLSYPLPIVEHKDARERCIRVYKEALTKK